MSDEHSAHRRPGTSTMDPAVLRDPSRCPDCFAVLPAEPVVCPACELPLRGPLLTHLWQLSLQAAAVLEQRVAVIATIRAQPEAAATAAGWHAPDAWTPAPHPAWSPEPTPWEQDPSPRRENVTSRQIQRLLLGLGVLLLGVAALIFVVVAWERIEVGGRTAILVGVTAAAGAGSVFALRRELAATSEALAALTVGLLLLDAFGAREYNLLGAASTATDAWWAGVLGALAVLAFGTGRVLPLQTPAWVAAIAVQLPVPILADRLGPIGISLALVVQGTLALAVVGRVRPTPAFAGPGTLAWLAGGVGSLLVAYDGVTEEFPAAAGAALLLVAAAGAAALAWDRRAIAWLSVPAAAAATAALLAAAHAPLERGLDHEVATAATVALVLVLAALLAALPDRASNGTTARLRFGPLTVVAFAAALAALDVGEPVAEAFAGALRHVADPWRYSANADAFERLDGSWPFHGAVACTVALLTAAAAVLAFRLRNTPAGMAATATAAFGSVATVPVAAIALRAPYLAAVLALVLLGVALVLFAARPSAERGGEVNDGVLSVGTSGKPRSVPPGTLDGVLLAAGAAAIALGLGWSLAASTATAWALGVLMAASLVGRGLLAPAGRPLASALAVAAIAAEAGVLAGATGAAGAEAGTVAIAAASLLAVAARLLREATERIVVETTCAFAALCAASTLGEDPHWAAIALLIVGVASAAVAMDPARRRLGWLSGTMLTLSSWVRLADTDVSTPEAYTLPPAAALLIYGALAHRGNRDLSSWRTFGPGLALALIPSLLATFDDDGLTRALLVGGGALVALLAGAAGRWQAPLALGAATLAVDAVVQVAPFADAVPRWVGIGLAGALLLALGATFEKRLRDLRRVADGFAHLG